MTKPLTTEQKAAKAEAQDATGREIAFGAGGSDVVELGWEPCPVLGPERWGKALVVCSRIAEGETLSAINQDEDMPATRTFHDWLRRSAELRKLYGHSREVQGHWLFDEILRLTGEVEHADHKGVRGLEVAIRTLQWVVARLAPKSYAERQARDPTVAITINTSLGGKSDDPDVGRRAYTVTARKTEESDDE